MGEKMKLIWGSGSVPCWKPMIVLEEKGLQGYESKLISFEKKEHKGENVLKLNPRGQVPTFQDEDVVINESGAICDYLEHAYPNKGTKLYPDDAKKRGKVLQRINEANSNIQNNVMEVMYLLMRNKDKMDNDDVKKELAEKKAEATKEIKIWEGYLKQAGAGKHLCGDEFTMADVILFPFVAFWFRLGLKGEKYPAVKAYYDMVKERPSIKATWPPHWKDSEGPKAFDDM